LPRYRIEFAKGEEVRFLSHLDLVKAFEMAIRRADIPIAFSEGFNPHPKMSFASALAVGVISEAEYLDIELKIEMSESEIKNRLLKSLPPGINVKTTKCVIEPAPSLMSEINRAVYRVKCETSGVIDQETLDESIACFLVSEEISILKKTKKGQRLKNIRPGIISFGGICREAGIDFSIITQISNEGSVRPEEVVRAFTEKSVLPINCDVLNIRRTALYIEKEGTAVNPMNMS
jgi:radical SAM-linked protein